jgi:hypothetical protein
VKFIHIAQHVVNDTSYETQVVNNPDKLNSQLVLEKLIQIAISTANINNDLMSGKGPIADLERFNLYFRNVLFSDLH